MSRGGSRYGAGRPAHNIKAESTQRIEIRRWVREGRFDGSHYFSAGWNRGGEPTGSISVHTTRDSAVLSYRIKDFHSDEWQDKREHVPVVLTTCHYGGTRRWFRCPVCQRRCELLYLRAYRFACRLCQKVAYSSQTGGPIDRLTHKFHKLQGRIADGKPKAMRRVTYARIWEQVNEIEALCDRHYAARLVRLGYG